MNNGTLDKVIELFDAQYDLFKKNFPESNELDIYEDVRHELVQEFEKIKESVPDDQITKTVISKLIARSQKGVRVYGQSCDRTDLSEAEWLQHLHEELMDATVYAQKLLTTKYQDIQATDNRVAELASENKILKMKLEKMETK